MKCTNCNERNAVYHYVSNVNGDVTETHLCRECAAKMKQDGGEYPWERFDKMLNDSFNSFFNDDPWFGGMMLPALGMGERRRPRSLFDSFFNDRDFFGLPRMGAMMLPAFFIPTGRPDSPAEEKVKEPENTEEKTEATATQETQASAPKAPRVDEAIARRRELNALREQMHRAARHEEYEKAAELRDRIRQLENRAQ